MSDAQQDPSPAVPRRVPLEIRLSIRDGYGRERSYAYAWEAIETLEDAPGTSGITLTTGLSGLDHTGIRAECTVRVGL